MFTFLSKDSLRIVVFFKARTKNSVEKETFKYCLILVFNFKLILDYGCAYAKIIVLNMIDDLSSFCASHQIMAP